MGRSYFPYYLLEGDYERHLEKNIPITQQVKINPKSKWASSWIKCIKDSHEIVNSCSIEDCINSSKRGIIVSCSYFDDIEEIHEFNEIYPNEMDESVFAVFPVCNSCEISTRGSTVRIETTECILFDSVGNGMIYRHGLHCGERMIIDENNPSASICNICNTSLDQMEYSDDVHRDNDDIVSNPNDLLWEH